MTHRGLLDDGYIPAPGGQRPRGGQAEQPGPDDGDLVLCHQSPRPRRAAALFS
jgi:hypothetical protein